MRHPVPVLVADSQAPFPVQIAQISRFLIKGGGDGVFVVKQGVVRKTAQPCPQLCGGEIAQLLHLPQRLRRQGVLAVVGLSLRLSLQFPLGRDGGFHCLRRLLLLTGVGGLAGRGLTACLSAGSSLASVCVRLIWLRRRFLFIDGRDQLAVVCLSVFLACVWLLL